MRRKKHKHVSRTLRFFKMQHGFRAPYKVLADGNFVVAARNLKQGGVEGLISRLLGAPVRVFTTSCVMDELRRMGVDYEEARRECRGLALHHCHHGKKQLETGAPEAADAESPPEAVQPSASHPPEASVAAGSTASASAPAGSTASASAPAARPHRPHRFRKNRLASAAHCLRSQVAQGNPEHFFVATQDRELQEKISHSSGGAVIFISVNGLHLLGPSEKDQHKAATKAERALHAPDQERKLLKEARKAEGRQRTSAVFRVQAVKAPNPLSVKKKLPKEPAGEDKAKRPRRRKRAEAGPVEEERAEA